MPVWRETELVGDGLEDVVAVVMGGGGCERWGAIHDSEGGGGRCSMLEVRLSSVLGANNQADPRSGGLCKRPPAPSLRVAVRLLCLHRRQPPTPTPV